MTDWPIKTHGEICEVISRGKPPAYCDYGGALVLNQKCIRNGQINFGLARRTDTSQKTIPDWAYLQVGDTLINSTGTGTLGRASFVARLDEPTTFDTHLTVVRPMPDFCWPAYVGLVLNSKELEIVELSGGTTGQTELPRESVRTFEIPMPPLDEQKRIVELLDAATARVTELTACYEQARTHANNLFASALRDALESDQSAPLRTLDELCEEGIVKLGRGNIISKKDIAAKPGSYPIYSSARENEGKFGEYGDYMFDEEMITWSIDGGGRLFYRPKHKFSVTNVGGTLRVLDPRLLDIQYLHRVLQNLHSQRVFDWVFKAHPSVIRKVYDAIPMPPLAEQKQIVASLDSMRAKTSEMVAAYDAKLTAAKNLRQSILEAAFAGDL